MISRQQSSLNIIIIVQVVDDLYIKVLLVQYDSGVQFVDYVTCILISMWYVMVGIVMQIMKFTSSFRTVVTTHDTWRPIVVNLLGKKGDM